jgi:hypothetical protein
LLVADEYVPSLHWPVVPAGAPAGTCAWAANAAKPNPNVIDINNAFMDSLSDWTPRPMR